MTLSPAFVQAVREGRVQGLTIDRVDWDDPESLWIGPEHICNLNDDLSDMPDLYFYAMRIDFFCAHLRRWMESKGLFVAIGPRRTLEVTELINSRVRPRQEGFIMLNPHTEEFTQDTELGRHVAAALWVLGDQ
jgi:hypothetical protein